MSFGVLPRNGEVRLQVSVGFGTLSNVGLQAGLGVVADVFPSGFQIQGRWLGGLSSDMVCSHVSDLQPRS